MGNILIHCQPTNDSNLVTYFKNEYNLWRFRVFGMNKTTDNFLVQHKFGLVCIIFIVMVLSLIFLPSHSMLKWIWIQNNPSNNTWNSYINESTAKICCHSFVLILGMLIQYCLIYPFIHLCLKTFQYSDQD